MADTTPSRERSYFEHPSILSFIAFDIASFVAFFGCFMIDRLYQPELFSQSAAMLDVNIGLANTLILLTSGWLVALAAGDARAGNFAQATNRLVLATIIGASFAVLKVFEYGIKIGQGLTAYTNDFFNYYYVLTGIHLFHLLIGLVLLWIVIQKTKRQTSSDPEYMNWLNSTAVYWHMVDLLWIFLFPMLYLQGV